jgi:DNA-binding transcriptional LysR family regulator
MVTPGAVSRQVQALEAFLGVRLFRREPREIVLTAEGEQYLASISAHLEGIREATQRLTGRRASRSCGYAPHDLLGEVADPALESPAGRASGHRGPADTVAG